MAASEVQDAEWDNLLEIAKDIQQNCYESYPEWTIYQESEHNYLKFVIGFALFGPPSEEKLKAQLYPTDENNSQTDENNSETDDDEDNDITKFFLYSDDEREIIDKIFKKIHEHGKGYATKESICFGHVYNVLFRTKKQIQTSNPVVPALTDSKTEETVRIDIKTTPIFKLKKRNIVKKNTQVRLFDGRVVTRIKNVEEFEIWYLDINGRIYKSWEGYKCDNKLNQCTMVLPKDGFYQPDPHYPITEDSSTVWIEVAESPACSAFSTFLKYTDTGSAIISTVGVGLGVASMFTPIGPVAAGIAIAASSAGGAWTFGRSAQNLADRATHEESINITDREALGSWLGVAGGAVGIAAGGTSFFVTKLAQAGKEVGTVTRVVYNTTTFGSLVVNGVGVGYEGYCLYESYQVQEEFPRYEAVLFAAHLLLFGNAVCNARFATDLIRSAQNEVIEDYRANVRSRRLRKAFNRARNAANLNNVDDLSSNVEVIRYINRKNAINLSFNRVPVVTTGTGNLSNITVEKGKIKIGDVVLQDPMQFARNLLVLNNSCQVMKNPISPVVDDDITLIDELRILKSSVGDMIAKFLKEINSTETISSAISRARTVLQDIMRVRNSTDILRIVLEITVKVWKGVYSVEKCYYTVLEFVWLYLKSHFEDCATSANDSQDDQFYKNIVQIMKYVDEFVIQMIPAFRMFTSQTTSNRN